MLSPDAEKRATEFTPASQFLHQKLSSPQTGNWHLTLPTYFGLLAG